MIKLLKKLIKSGVKLNRLMMLISYVVICICLVILAIFRPFDVKKVEAKKTVTKKVVKKTTVKKTYTIAELKAENYPAELVEFAQKYPETMPFVADYKKDAAIYNKKTISIKGEVTKGTIPLFIQWDKRWGYRKYAGGFFATRTCGPTCMSMVYSGLTGKTDQNPYKMAQWSYKNGYYENGQGTRWIFMHNAAVHFGLTEIDIRNSPSTIKEYIKNGYVLIANVKKGDFTTSGHYIVITGIDASGKLTINDPNSRINSSKSWDINRVSKQIKLLGAFK
jgi:hypothetical protein